MARHLKLLTTLGLAALSLASAPAFAQHHPRPRHTTPTPTPAPPPPPPPSAEVIAVPVADVDGMLRRMRVWLFAPPPGSTAFGITVPSGGHAVWALLPSCRPANPDDPRDQCPVDHITFEAVSGGGVTITDAQPLSNAPDARRVQPITINASVTRIRVRVMNSHNQSRYEAIIDAAGLADLPAPQGQSRGGSFVFDLAQYPAR